MIFFKALKQTLKKEAWINKAFICLSEGCQQVLSVVFLRVAFDLTHNPFQCRVANAALQS